MSPHLRAFWATGSGFLVHPRGLLRLGKAHGVGCGPLHALEHLTDMWKWLPVTLEMNSYEVGKPVQRAAILVWPLEGLAWPKVSDSGTVTLPADDSSIHGFYFSIHMGHRTDPLQIPRTTVYIKNIYILLSNRVVHKVFYIHWAKRIYIA